MSENLAGKKQTKYKKNQAPAIKESQGEAFATQNLNKLKKWKQEYL